MTGPGRRTGGWSPDEAAEELHRRRAELIGQLRRRNDGRGVPLAAQEEIVDDAITAVVMSPRGVRNEHHMLGAFWLAVEHRCNRYREGRHFTRLGSRLRVEFDAAVQQATSRANPYEKLALRDRFARAADLMAELDPRERQVVSVMACYGVGPVPAARLLGLPLGEVRSAVRSANAKLDRVAAIAAAGRMCQFRERVIAADAAGEADEHDARLARAHVTACVPCGKVCAGYGAKCVGASSSAQPQRRSFQCPPRRSGTPGVSASSPSGSNIVCRSYRAAVASVPRRCLAAPESPRQRWQAPQ